jgi:hypothetical protein
VTDKVMAEFMRLGLDENMQSPEALLTEHEAGIRAAARVKYGAPDTDSNGIPVTSFSKPQPPAQPAELTPQQAAAKMEELKSDPMFVKRYVAGDAQAGREMLALMQKISPRRK